MKKLINHPFFQKRLAAGTAFAAALASARGAEAKTLRDIINHFRHEVLDPAREFFVYGCGFVGLILIAYGFFRLYQRSKQHQQQQITVNEIIVSIVVGALLMVISVVSYVMVESVTGETSTALDRF